MNNELELEYEDSKRGVKFRVKGTPEIVEAYIKNHGYSEIMKPISNEVKPTTSEIDIPDKPQANSISQYILELIYSSWGAKGRTSTELINVASSHGLALTSSTLSGILNNLARTGKLRRLKHAGENQQWVYYPPTSVSLNQE